MASLAGILGSRPSGGTLLERPSKRARTEPPQDVPMGGDIYVGGTRKGMPRRSYRRRRRNRRKGIIRRRIPRLVAPRSKLVRMRTVHIEQYAPAAATLKSIYVNLFDITDPFGAASQEQPLGYDQWKSLYNKAYVVGLKVTVRVHNRGTSAVVYGVTPIPENQGNTALGNYQHYMELGSTKARILSPDVDHGILVSKVSAKKHIHARKLSDEDAFHVDLDNETAPTRTAYVHVWAQCLDQTTTTWACESVITAEYIIRLYDPIVPARSADS